MTAFAAEYPREDLEATSSVGGIRILKGETLARCWLAVHLSILGVQCSVIARP